MRLTVVSSNNERHFIAQNFISCIYHVYSTFDENVIQVLTAVNNYAMDIHMCTYFLGIHICEILDTYVEHIVGNFEYSSKVDI